MEYLEVEREDRCKEGDKYQKFVNTLLDGTQRIRILGPHISHAYTSPEAFINFAPHPVPQNFLIQQALELGV